MVSSPNSIGRGQWSCNFIFLLFSCMCFWQFSASGHSPLDLIWWLTFQVPDWWDSIDLSDFLAARPMEFHWSGHWNFKTLCILLFEYELGWIASLASGTSQQSMDFKGKNWKNFQNSFFTAWKLTLVGESPVDSRM